MLSNNNHTQVLQRAVASNNLPPITTNFSELLEFFKIPYTLTDFYLQVGDIKKAQGWILHLSVIISQIQPLLALIIPLLYKENIPFKIAMNEDMCKDLLLGNLGVPKLGKIVSIYPEDDSKAIHIAKRLISETACFKGPAIPTDVCLGNIVFTRYGSFAPIIRINVDENKEKYIYDQQEQLVRDYYSIPFQLPQGIQWPFGELANPILSTPKKVLRKMYKPISYLKTEPRGSVMIGLYLKSLIHIKKCVIKQGFRNMASDANGRDIQDRLSWQYELYQQLSGFVPMPIMFDKFQEEEGTYLVMEYINGKSLYTKLADLNPHCKSWHELGVRVKLKIVNYLINISSIVHKLHQKGYVHRDVVSVNFLIDKKNRVFLIDNELAYSLTENYPSPPFDLGTPGFMSPEQQAIQTPTIKEDIYGLGALLLESFTGLTPIKFNTSDPGVLYKNMLFFIGNQDVATTITSCLRHDPSCRPEIATIESTLNNYKQTLLSNKTSAPAYQKITTKQLKELVSSGLKGITIPPVIYFNGTWLSEKNSAENVGSLQQKEYELSPGLSKGVTGVLYLLARVQQSGIDINTCSSGYFKSWEILEENYLKKPEMLSPGLYMGSAGLALALSNGIQSGILIDNFLNREKIRRCLEISNADLTLANGQAGKGVSILQCRKYLPEHIFLSLLNNTIASILEQQHREELWKMNEALSFGYGIGGITWFLLEYLSKHPDNKIQLLVEKFIFWILKKGKGQRGDILTLIKAYEVLHDIHYRKIAEKNLRKLPYRMTGTDFTQQSGLAYMGELYIEASQVFNNEEWWSRADWIANVYKHSFFSNQNGYGYWVMDENSPPTADFMKGNSGIIHFLLRCITPLTIGYRLLK